jgi:hypothetical protein
MAQTLKAFLAAATIAFGLFSPYAMAQGSPAATGTAIPVVQPSDAQLQRYADIYKVVVKEAEPYQTRFSAAKTDEERQAIVVEADQRLVDVVKGKGMELDEYNGISLAIQQDPALRTRVEAMVK